MLSKYPNIVSNIELWTLWFKACCHYQSFPSKTWSKKTLTKTTWSKSCVVTIKAFLMIGQRNGGNSMFTKSKMAPVNISQNDYLALSLYVFCVLPFWGGELDIPQIWVGKRRTRYWLLRRKQRSTFNTLLQELHSEDPVEFKNYFRMDKAMFKVLLAKVKSTFLPCAFCLVNKFASFQNSTLIG